MLNKLVISAKILFIASFFNACVFLPIIGYCVMPEYMQVFLLKNNYTKLAYLYSILLAWAEIFEYFALTVALVSFTVFIFSLFNNKLAHFFKDREKGEGVASYIHAKYESRFPVRYIQLKQRLNELNNKTKKK